MEIPTEEELLSTIDAFLERHGMAPTRFGAMATGEPQLLSSIRGGRSPSLKVLRRLKAFMERTDAEKLEADGAAADHAAPDTTEGDATSSGNPGEVSAQAEGLAA